MKIAHVVRYYPHAPYINGLEVAIIQLDKTLKELGYDSEIISIDDPQLFQKLEGYNKILIHFRRSSALKLMSWCKKRKIPTYLFCHNGIGNVYSCIPNFFKRLFTIFSESNYIYKGVDQVIVFNSEDYKYLDAWFPNLKKSQVAWGIDYEKFCFKDPSVFYKKLNLKGNEVLILYPARIHPTKNFTLPIQIWDEISESYPTAHLVFMGNVGQKDYKCYLKLKELANNVVHKEKIHWVNDISYGDAMLVSAYSAANIVIFPSLKESFGLVLLEACAVGKPIVASPVGVAPSLIRNGINGFLCDPEDYNEWKRCIFQLLEDPKLREEIGANAKEEVIEKYSWKQSALKILEIINNDKVIF